jgi:hypothetical protein
VAEEAAKPATQAAASEELAPPRELMTLLAALSAIACAGLVVFGGWKKWTAPTLGVLLLLGGAEALVAIGLTVHCALSEGRRKGAFVLAVAATALSALALASILVLSGTI